MEGLLQNATVYFKVLSKASTHQIQDWKQDDVKNAFKWTGYFQKVMLLTGLIAVFVHILQVSLANVCAFTSCFRLTSNYVRSLHCCRHLMQT